MIPTNSGKHRQRVTILSLAENTRDTFGQPVQQYTTVGTYWAEVRPLRTSEGIVAKQVKAQATHKVKFRYLGSGVTLNTTNRITLNGRTMGLSEVLNVEERNRRYECIAYEIQQSGQI